MPLYEEKATTCPLYRVNFIMLYMNSQYKLWHPLLTPWGWLSIQCDRTDCAMLQSTAKWIWNLFCEHVQDFILEYDRHTTVLSPFITLIWHKRPSAIQKLMHCSTQKCMVGLKNVPPSTHYLSLPVSNTPPPPPPPSFFGFSFAIPFKHFVCTKSHQVQKWKVNYTYSIKYLNVIFL